MIKVAKESRNIDNTKYSAVWPAGGKEGRPLARNLDYLYEKAEREYNSFRSNWDWFVAQQQLNQAGDPWAEVLARIYQN